MQKMKFSYKRTQKNSDYGNTTADAVARGKWCWRKRPAAGFHEFRQVLQLSNSGASCRSPKQRRIRNAPRKYVGFCGLHLHLLLCSSTIHALGGRLRITFCSLNLLRLAPAQPWTSHTVIPIIVAYQVHADSIRSACHKLHKIIMDIISGYV
ncbi:hypothetical protein ACOSP7_017629 [Xanthoceras sorbifolium]